jgi:hypothetical protein
MVERDIRGMFSGIYLFACDSYDAKILAEEWNHPELKLAAKFKPGELFRTQRMKPLERGYLDFDKKSVTLQRCETLSFPGD